MINEKKYADLALCLAINLSHARRAKWLTQEQLAKATGIKRSTLSYIERGTGNPGVTYIFKLAQFYRLPIAQLFERKFVEPKIFGSNTSMFEECVVTTRSTKEISLAIYQKAWFKVVKNSISVICPTASIDLNTGETIELKGPGNFRFVNFGNEDARLLGFSEAFAKI